MPQQICIDKLWTVNASKWNVVVDALIVEKIVDVVNTTLVETPNNISGISVNNMSLKTQVVGCVVTLTLPPTLTENQAANWHRLLSEKQPGGEMVFHHVKEEMGLWVATNDSSYRRATDQLAKKGSFVVEVSEKAPYEARHMLQFKRALSAGLRKLSKLSVTDEGVREAAKAVASDGPYLRNLFFSASAGTVTVPHSQLVAPLILVAGKVLNDAVAANLDTGSTPAPHTGEVGSIVQCIYASAPASCDVGAARVVACQCVLPQSQRFGQMAEAFCKDTASPCILANAEGKFSWEVDDDSDDMQPAGNGSHTHDHNHNYNYTYPSPEMQHGASANAEAFGVAGHNDTHQNATDRDAARWNGSHTCCSLASASSTTCNFSRYQDANHTFVEGGEMYDAFPIEIRDDVAHKWSIFKGEFAYKDRTLTPSSLPPPSCLATAMTTTTAATTITITTTTAATPSTVEKAAEQGTIVFLSTIGASEASGGCSAPLANVIANRAVELIVEQNARLTMQAVSNVNGTCTTPDAEAVVVGRQRRDAKPFGVEVRFTIDEPEDGEELTQGVADQITTMLEEGTMANRTISYNGETYTMSGGKVLRVTRAPKFDKNDDGFLDDPANVAIVAGCIAAFLLGCVAVAVVVKQRSDSATSNPGKSQSFATYSRISGDMNY